MLEIFDDWPERYDEWFETPIGILIKEYESRLVLEMLKPARDEKILDAGCGTGLFTSDILSAGANAVGLELSLPMLMRAGKKLAKHPFRMVQGDMRNLPFADQAFDKAVSITAIEFIRDASGVIEELLRVTKPGGCIVVATLNSLSPWNRIRKEKARKGHSLFKHAVFRSPEEIGALLPVQRIIKTAIHFQKHDDPEAAKRIEQEGQAKGLNSGAFVIARWERPTTI